MGSELFYSFFIKKFHPGGVWIIKFVLMYDIFLLFFTDGVVGI